jgi:hypothetical protein
VNSRLGVHGRRRGRPLGEEDALGPWMCGWMAQIELTGTLSSYLITVVDPDACGSDILCSYPFNPLDPDRAIGFGQI